MSMLSFIGCGSAFNTKLGNNSAFIKQGSELFMIDCGSANFDRIQNKGLLAGVDKITVLLTHLHPDHVGSLGDLLFYAYFGIQPMFTPKLTVITPRALKDSFKTLMACIGVSETQYIHVEIADTFASEAKMCGIASIRPFTVEHAKELICYGYVLEVEGKRVYYSGDAKMIPDEVLVQLHNGDIDYFYQDTCKADYEGNVHLSLRKLTELIPAELRDKVYCMHLDAVFSREEATALGFNVVSAD
jgi:ribonuclease BN (tRNA processing enzyme)